MLAALSFSLLESLFLLQLRIRRIWKTKEKLNMQYFFLRIFCSNAINHGSGTVAWCFGQGRMGRWEGVGERIGGGGGLLDEYSYLLCKGLK